MSHHEQISVILRYVLCNEEAAVVKENFENKRLVGPFSESDELSGSGSVDFYAKPEAVSEFK